MPKYVVGKKDGTTKTVEADYFEQDGSGLRFFKRVTEETPNPDPDKKAPVKTTVNRMIASYVDGSYTSCELE